MYTRLVGFDLGGAKLPVDYQESMHIKDDVNCDVYSFTGDLDRDLGIVSVVAGISTPSQRVILGEKTIEGYVSGKGTLTVVSESGEVNRYSYPDPDLP